MTLEIFEKKVEKVYKSIVWSHKIQEKDADYNAAIYKFIEFFNILTLALSSTGIVSIYITDWAITDRKGEWITLTTLIVSFIGLLLTLIVKTWDFKTNAYQHKEAALNLLELRNDFYDLIMEIESLKNTNSEEDTIQELEKTYNELIPKLEEVHKKTPMYSKHALKKAEKELKCNNTWLNIK